MVFLAANESLRKWGRWRWANWAAFQPLVRLGLSLVETEAARLMVYRCASQKDAGNLGNVLETVMAKYYSCDVASRVADGALRILGAYGYSSEYPVERLFRDAKLYQVLEGQGL